MAKKNKSNKAKQNTENQNTGNQNAGEQEKQTLLQKMNSAPVFHTDDEFAPGTGQNLVDADFARQAAEHEAGVEETTYGVFKYIYAINKFLDSHRSDHVFKKKTYLWLMLFTGWAGGHRWYQGRKFIAALMTIFCWTGVPLIMCVTDLMEVIPVKPDENGYITMR